MKYLIIVIILLIIVFILLYNKIIRQNMRCKNAFASIDNQLKRRNDLIPNLVEITKRYMKYETETLEKIVKIRSENINELAHISDNITNNVKTLFAKAENYPDLKANEIFKKLQILVFPF